MRLGVRAHDHVETELAQPALGALVAGGDGPGRADTVACEVVQGRAVECAQVGGDDGDVGKSRDAAASRSARSAQRRTTVRSHEASSAVTSSASQRLTAVSTVRVTSRS